MTTDSLLTLDIDGCAVPLRVRRNARARNLILRLDEQTGGAVVTIPKRTSIQEAYDMALRKSDWIAVQLKRRPAQVAFAAGAVLPYLGADHTVLHHPKGRGIARAQGEIWVSGREEHLPRRLLDWLKAQAKAEITPRAHAKAESLKVLTPRRVGRITVRDTRSRWGSCAADGQLNFSWRLILTPEFVLDYVVAHEVAHLVHRNHSADFWALTDSLTSQMDAARAWLNAHGRGLHRFG
jgi:hypothetical protein